jgi:hypothetical protein
MPESTPSTPIIEESQTLWDTDRQPAGCTHCQRGFLVQELFLNTVCPLCRQGKLEPQPLRMRLEQPEQVLPFRINQHKLHAIYENFVSEVWIKPDDFTSDLLLKRSIPVFWPLWLVDSDISGSWQMEAGFDYQVESTKEIFASGQWQSQKNIETRVRWEPRLGKISTHVSNVAVPALTDHQNRQQMTGQYAIDQANAFDPTQLGNALMEIPNLPPEDAWPLAKPQVDKTAAKICANAAGAQHLRHFTLKATDDNLTWTQFFLPLYATFYTDDEGQPQSLIVNGETGAIHGPQLASRKKGLQIAGILAGGSGLLLVLALIGLLLTAVFPPAGIFAAVIGVLGIGLGISAIIPAVWPGQWNRKQESARISTGQ